MNNTITTANNKIITLLQNENLYLEGVLPLELLQQDIKRVYANNRPPCVQCESTTFIRGIAKRYNVVL